jgi:hypothetical protein
MGAAIVVSPIPLLIDVDGPTVELMIDSQHALPSGNCVSIVDGAYFETYTPT